MKKRLLENRQTFLHKVLIINVLTPRAVYSLSRMALVASS